MTGSDDWSVDFPDEESQPTKAVLTNPFVGPRPFEPGERLWGRDQEISELDNLLNAERIVLLHSPSGAGKSSLVQAGLLPRLKRSFDIWGPTRFNQEPPAPDVLGWQQVNRYVLSAVLGFEETVPERLRRPIGELAAQTLSEYVEQRPRRRSAPNNLLLVFDQFEEVLTVDPLAVEAKQELFKQLGELLRNRRVWALFALREDYLAPLDPYARQVPTHLKNRFRIDLLGLDRARRAMVEPARECGREFPAADQLVHDLATMRLQQTDGSFSDATGQHVEPVQLQVVCRRLWSAIPADDLSINREHLAQFGDVSGALAGYYADSVSRLAGGDLALERAIREWFSNQLITSDDTRSQVLRGTSESAGLSNQIIVQLLDTHIVRAEERAGAIWYELAHDRLIEPVSSDNTAWLLEHLSDVQRQAALWESQGRPPGLLPEGDELVSCEAWAAEDKNQLTEVERDFLAQARRVETRKRQLKRLSIAARVVSVLAVIAGALAIAKWDDARQKQREAEALRAGAVAQREEADRQRQRAEQEKTEADVARALEQEQRQEADQQRQMAEKNERLAEARKASAEEAREASEKAQAEAEQARDRADESRNAAEEARRHAEEEKARADRNAATSQTLRFLAVAKELALQTLRLPEGSTPELVALLALQAYRLNRENGGEADDPDIYTGLWEASKRLSPGVGVLHRYPDEVRTVDLLPDGRRLVAAGEDGVVYLVDLGQPEDHRRLATSDSLGMIERRIRSLAVASSGLVAAGTVGGAVLLWDQALGRPRVLRGPRRSVNALVFQPGSANLAAGSADGVWLWDLSVARTSGRQLSGSDAVYGLAFHPDGSTLASAGKSGLGLWDLTVAEPTLSRFGGDQKLRSLAFCGDSGMLAGGAENGSILVWNLAEGDNVEPITLTGHTAAVTALAFNPVYGQLASASLDSRVRLWPFKRPGAPPIVLGDHGNWVWDLVFAPGGDTMFSSGSDNAVRGWQTRAELLAAAICSEVDRGLTAEEWQEYLPSDLPRENACPDPPPGETQEP